jgi:hypothetical protein
MMVSGLMALVFWSRAWLAFFIPALILAAPQALWLRSTGVRGELFKLHFGWDAGGMPVVTFWLLNAGAFLLLLVIALLMKRFGAPRQRWFYIPFLLCFEVPNVVLLAPWQWDNIKVLVYWYLASCPLVAMVLAYLFARQAMIWRIVGAMLLLTLTLSGALDVARALSPVEDVLLFGRAELEVAELIRERTEPRAMMLTAPIHNSVVALTGRPWLMGYPGHLWTHGIEHGERRVEIEAIYHGEEGAPDLLARHRIDYVVIGPAEREQLQANESFFARYPVVIDHAGYQVYQIRGAGERGSGRK